MKKNIPYNLISMVLFILLFSTIPLFSQSFGNDSLTAIRPKNVIKIDFYASGKVKMITYLGPDYDKISTYPFLCNRIIKTVFQYDECNNLRNISIVYKGLFDTLGYVSNHESIKIKEFCIENVKCDTLWIKPIITLEAW